MAYDIKKSRRDSINREAPDSIKKKMEEGLLAENISEHMDIKKKAEEAERDFWRYSKLWRSIEDNLLYGDKCPLIDRERAIRCYSAGPGISLINVRKYRRFDDKADTWKPWEIVFEISVEYCNGEDRYSDDDDSYGETRKHWINVPLEFATNWDKYKWDKWMEAEIEKGEKDRKESELREFEAKIEKLINKYPEVTEEIREMLDRE